MLNRPTSSKRVKWTVYIPSFFWMAGTHTFRTKRLAQEFIAQWRKAEANDRSDASITLRRNGKAV